MNHISKKWVAYFAENHYLTNLVLFAVIAGGFFSWSVTPKEARPDITFNRISITTLYPGASPSVAEQWVARPLETRLRGIEGVDEVKSSCTEGGCTTSVSLEPSYSDPELAKGEIRNAVMATSFPAEVMEVLDNPKIREHKAANIPLVDVGLYFKGLKYLDDNERRRLQAYALSLENRLNQLPFVNEIRRSGYLEKEIHIELTPARMREYEISMNEVIKTVRNNSIKQPAGALRTLEEARVSVDAELRTVEQLRNLVVQGSFMGASLLRLGQFSKVNHTFEESTSLFKINGFEAISLSVIKSEGHDILGSRQKLFAEVERFQKEVLGDAPVEVVYIDDESRHIRNRLSIITTNGLIGFTLILMVLFLFLDFRSGVWVAIGIPFTLCFTLIFISIFGYTINNITLAGIIIVMGIVVDDAIIVAENVHRTGLKIRDKTKAAVEGTTYMFLPILASIVTTCIAFVPLFYLPGIPGKFVELLPVVIFLMLGASLFESLFILPSHLLYQGKLFFFSFAKISSQRGLWFEKIESVYEKLLTNVLHRRGVAIAVLLFACGGIIYLGGAKLKFVMFPREEVTEFFIEGEAAPGTRRLETAHLAEQVEDVLAPYLGGEVMSYMTNVGKNRRGAKQEESKFAITIEIPQRHERERSSREMIAEWEEKFKAIKNINKLRVIKSRFGGSSGAALDIEVAGNSDSERSAALSKLKTALEAHPGLHQVELENDTLGREYRADLKREALVRLNVDAATISPTLRASLEGVVASRFYEGDEEVAIRVVANRKNAADIGAILQIPVENRARYLVPLGELLSVREVFAPTVVIRREFLRTETLLAGIRDESGLTPLEVATELEESVFPEIHRAHPGVQLSFSGEVEDSRETQDQMKYVIVAVFFGIFVILILLFRSFQKPFVIMSVIPFGVMGIVLTLFGHGQNIYGFFTIIGALGLAGVVVNDSIVMVTKLEREKKPGVALSPGYIASIAKTRLRAIVLTTLTTVAGLFPTAYGVGGYDSFLSDMMLVLAWGLIFGTFITLFFIPLTYSLLGSPPSLPFGSLKRSQKGGF